MKKKAAVMLISGLMVLSLAGCGAKELSNDNITIPQYKDIEVDEIEDEKVTKENVEAEIETRLNENAKDKEIKDRAVKEGDVVNMNYVGKIDGKEFEGGSAEDAELTIGSGQFIPGFEDGIIGHKTGETFDIDVTFPKEYYDSNMAGKKSVFTITLNKVVERTIPKLDKEFVKEVSDESKTVKEYKKEVKKELQEKKEKEKKTTLGQSALTKITEKTKVKKYPKKRLAEEEESLDKQYKDMAEYYKMEFADFISERMGMTEKDFAKQVKKAAKESIKSQMIVELIAKEEGIKLTEKQYEKAYEELAVNYGYQDVKSFKEAAPESTLKSLALQQKVCLWLGDNCIQVEKEQESSSTITEESKDPGSDGSTSGSSSDK